MRSEYLRRRAATVLGVAAAAAALGLAAPGVASAAGAPCGLSYPAGSGQWHNCGTTSELIGSVAYDPVTERITNQSQCVPAGETRLLSPTFFTVSAYVAGYGC